MKYARQCDITGEGMNQGYVLGDGVYYVKYDKDLAEKLREWYLYDEVKHMTDDELKQFAYDEDEYYWTEWECPEDFQYEEVNGKLIEINQ